MAVTGWKTPGTAASVDRDSKSEWNLPNNAKVSDDVDTGNAVVKTDYSDWLRVTNFGFTTSDIPSGAIIDGIEVKIEHAANTINLINDSAVYLRKTSGQVGSNKASATFWPTSDAEATYGGAADTWTAGLVDTDVVSTDFGVDLSAWNDSAVGTEGATVDCISVRVYYTEAGGSDYGDIPSRFKLIAHTYKTIASRFRLIIRSYQDIASRFVLAIPNQTYTFIASRFYLVVATKSYKYISSRFKIWGHGYKSIPSRFVLQGGPQPILEGVYYDRTRTINRVLLTSPYYSGKTEAETGTTFGERLRPLQTNLIVNRDDATRFVSSALAKARFESNLGQIKILPNCGQEPFDVIGIYDKFGKDGATSFRVAAIVENLNWLTGDFEETLVLTEI